MNGVQVAQGVENIPLLAQVELEVDEAEEADPEGEPPAEAVEGAESVKESEYSNL